MSDSIARRALDFGSNSRLYPQVAPRPFHLILEDLGYPTDWLWAWDNYKPTVLEIARAYGLSRHLKIGGGRDPLFGPDELSDEGISVTLNDISERELSLAPAGFRTIAHDISALSNRIQKPTPPPTGISI